jgi:2,3-dihydroxybenzoate-AMP ligase
MCAFVILKTNKTLVLKELVDFLLTKEIAKFKLPERLEALSDFPVSTFGKVSKKALGEWITQKMQDESKTH